MSQTTERRSNPRYDVQLATQLTPEGASSPFDATVKNLSIGGAYVTVPTGWTPTERAPLNLAFQMKGNESFQIQANVARIAGDHIGVSINPGQTQNVNQLLGSPRQV